MKKLFISLTVLLGIIQLATAQQKSYEEVVRASMRTDKKEAIAQVMALSDSMAKVFWPMYNEYELEYAKQMDERIAIIEDFANNYKSMTNEKATELMKRTFANKNATTKLMDTWSKKFVKKIGALKTLTFMQAENKISAIVDYSIASEVPMYQK